VIGLYKRPAIRGERGKPQSNGLDPEIPVEFYIRETAHKSVLIKGSKQTI